MRTIAWQFSLLSSWIFLLCYREESFLLPDKKKVEKEDLRVMSYTALFNTRTSAGSQLPRVGIGVATNCPLQHIKPRVGQNRGKLRWCLKGEQAPGVQDDLWFPCCGMWQEGPSQSQLVQERRAFLQGEKWKRCL